MPMALLGQQLITSQRNQFASLHPLANLRKRFGLARQALTLVFHKQRVVVRLRLQVTAFIRVDAQLR